MKMIKAPIIKRLSTKIGISAFFTVLFVLALSVIQQQATFATLAGFDPGNIMEDIVMSKKNSMTQAQVQTFLKSKNSCNDTNLGRLTGYNSTDKNKATQGWIKTGGKTFYYNLKNGHFVCMADQSFNGESAARIIWQAGQDYNVNPQVIITLLEKEQGLVTDTWPNTNYQYAAATGYDCPDTGSGCNNENSGFKTQIRKAAGLFHEVLSGGWSNYPVGNNYIQYSPSASCGGSTVNIRNRATSALYRYTPYQPNQAALKAGWGEAPCGAYGNRNFYNLFTTWFGSTRGTIDIKGINIENPSFTDSPTTASFTITNNTKRVASFPILGIAARDPNNLNLDFPPVRNISLSPGQSYTYRQSRTLNGIDGSYSFYIARYDGTSWHYPAFNDYGQTEDGGVNRIITKKPTLTQSLKINSSSGSSIHANQATTVTFKLRNQSTQPIPQPKVMVAGRGPSGENMDLPLVSGGTLAAGAEYTYNQSISFPKPGRYNLYVSSYQDGFGWNENFPSPQSPDIVRKITVDVKDSVTVTQPLAVSIPNGRAGGTATATFKIKNFSSKSIEVGKLTASFRNSRGRNMDFPLTNYLTLAPDEEYSYSAVRILVNPDIYTGKIASFKNIGGWSESMPRVEQDNIQRNVSLNLKNELRLTSGLELSQSGNTVTAQFKIKNYAATTQQLGIVTASARDKNGQNVDFPLTSYISLGPGEEYSYNKNHTFSSGSVLTIQIADYRSAFGWRSNFPESEQSNLSRSTTYVVQ